MVAGRSVNYRTTVYALMFLEYLNLAEWLYDNDVKLMSVVMTAWSLTLCNAASGSIWRI